MRLTAELSHRITERCAVGMEATGRARPEHIIAGSTFCAHLVLQGPLAPSYILALLGCIRWFARVLMWGTI
jgi:hypothetical protein